MGWRGVTTALGEAVDVIWPRLCESCGKPLVRGEEMVCLSCLYDLPYTGLADEWNEIHHRVAGHAPIARAASMFYYYPDSDSARLIRKAKYRGLPRLARRMGEYYAIKLSDRGFFQGVDLLLPVPLHWFKQLMRGYNQSEEIAEGIAKVTGIAIGDNLRCRRSHGSQTRRNAFARWLNAKDLYAVVDSRELDGLHVMIIDDIITTGATILACAEALHRAVPTATISVLSLGLTHHR